LRRVNSPPQNKETATAIKETSPRDDEKVRVLEHTLTLPAGLIFKMDICYEQEEIHKNFNENKKNNLHSVIENSLMA
jgi:hypothetical protein